MVSHSSSLEAQFALKQVEPNSGLGKAITYLLRHWKGLTAFLREAGDLFMSLIHTCELASANPFDYLAELQRHPAELASNPSAWMPWNYSERLARVAVS